MEEKEPGTRAPDTEHSKCKGTEAAKNLEDALFFTSLWGSLNFSCPVRVERNGH